MKFDGDFATQPNKSIMNSDDLKAELSITSLELEKALDLGMPHAELIQIYRRIKELQYQLLMLQVNQAPNASAETISSFYCVL